MPDWLLVLLGVVGGGLGATLLSLRHERAAGLRVRMLEAADDFVETFTSAREATSLAAQEVAWVRSFGDLADVDEATHEKWRDEKSRAVIAAREACDVLRRRQPRIVLLFGVHSPAEQSASSAYRSLSILVAEMTVAEDDESKSTDEERDRWSRADRALETFGRDARDAILASPWSVRPLLSRARVMLRRVLRGERVITSRR
jgi:hypothetical protein